ncbi:MAG: C1 family peptidase, partial [Bacteroidota bacterium]
VRQALAARRPGVVGLCVLRNFYELKNAHFWNPHLGNTAPAGGHALVVVSYDDRKEAFRLFNSWGKNWGDGGYIWLKYKDFGDFCKYAYLLHLAGKDGNVASQTDSTAAAKPATLPISNPAIEEKPLVELAGNFTFRNLTGWSQSGQPVFENAPVELQGNIYRLQHKDWQVGQLFQLLAATLRDDEYLYVFSVDASREVHFHYPRQEGLNEKFAGQNESGLLLAGGAQVAIPSETKALKLAHPGTDRLVVLFSKRKIQTVKKLAEMLCRKEGDFMQNLLAALGKYAVPQSDITYSAERIGFVAATRSEGTIVPLVLEVEAKN